MTTTKKNRSVALIAFLILAGIIYGGSYYYMHVHTAKSDIVDLFVTVALMFVIPFLVNLLVIPNKISLFFAFFIEIFVSKYLIAASHQRYLDYVIFYVAPLVEIFFLCFIFFQIIRLYRDSKKHADRELSFYEAMEVALTKLFGDTPLKNVFLAEIKLFYYSFGVLFKKPDIRKDISYSYHKTTIIKTMMIVFGLLLIAETVLLHWLLAKWSIIAAWIATAISIYAALYIVAFYNSVKYLPCTVTEDKVTLYAGYQSIAVIDIANIEAIQSPNMSNVALNPFEKGDSDVVNTTLMMDSPSFEIKVKESAIHYGVFGMKKEFKRIMFKVDEPESFAQAIRSRMEKLQEQHDKENTNM
ncbi:hypothetical protein GOP56_05090 [Brevibacillus sp. 7WMA2]|uniref:hypothetical protein n=1 Tax=Brevibacillus TaxID=55080 RepID=UPI000839D5EC|nr:MULTISPECIES: hypothetical protein [Brevibacillus]AYK08263.1 hypothetical protein D8Z77_18900 [Brevibacillus laterosporus]MBA4533174.1 hypothetical protein [Brevibacillus halotolerans]MCR8993706.1 hypothetical protein [Brevibacillus laterosporus]MDF9410551.1 hypothetical protein [Brevibacillus laterosporus]QIC05022.1 hypothetical protein GOP56_05090 [Brevibacillus sp. 7WMA2]